MKTILSSARFLLNVTVGTLLFILSPGFRATVRAKLRSRGGVNEPVNQGEQVIAVLVSDSNNDKKFIGGKS
jgi:hypothetical protein